MEEAKQTNESLGDALIRAQLYKLRLETEALERTTNKKSTRHDKVIQYIPIITALLAVAGFLFGIYQFNQHQIEQGRQQEEQSKRDYQAREKEFKKVLWEKQLALYVDISKSTAQVAATSDEAERKRLYRELSSHFNGDLIVVADRDVMESVLEFDQLYEAFLSDPGRQEDLLASARKLARACRNSLIKTFNVQLGDLRDYKEVKQEENHGQK
jgi:hypothetical protein